MKIKRAWKWIKFVFFLIYGLIIISLIISLAVMFYYALTDKNAVENSRIVNTLSLAIGFISLPGISIQLLSLLDFNKKMKFKAVKQCPHCKHKIDLTLEEA